MFFDTQYDYQTGFQGDAQLRSAFNQLANSVFGLDFEPWFQRGYWTDSYIPFTLFDGACAVANVSANRFTLVLNGETRRAIQFGTVMTHPQHRQKGLASRLLRHAIDCLKDESDLFYLMGDKDALGFYRKLGFTEVDQFSYSLQPVEGKKQPEWAATTGLPSCRRLQFDDKADADLLLFAASCRIPVSRRAGLLDAGHLLAFYAMNGFGDKIWLARQGIQDTDQGGFGPQDVIVIFDEADGCLHLHDVLCQSPVSIRQLMQWLPHEKLNSVHFGFTPDQMNLSPEEGVLLEQPLKTEDAFFAIPADAFGSTPFLYPPIGLA